MNCPSNLDSKSQQFCPHLGFQLPKQDLWSEFNMTENLRGKTDAEDSVS